VVLARGGIAQSRSAIRSVMGIGEDWLKDGEGLNELREK
jgi:hypothetical protein